MARYLRLVVVALTALLCSLFLAPAGAQAAPADPCAVPEGSLAPGESATNRTPYDPKAISVSIAEADLRRTSENAITMQIAVRNRDGRPICANYAVFLTFNRLGQEAKAEPEGCADQSFNDPGLPRGTYHCTAIVDGPGTWEFVGTVNQPAVQTNLAVVDTALDVQGIPQLGCESCGIKYVVEGSAFEVFLLQAHVAMAGLWMLLCAVMAFLALPRLRRTLSVLAVHALEVRRGFLVSALWGTFGTTLGTGLYLLASQTAYEAPFSTNAFSTSAWDRITDLPYAQNYFLVLYGKILIFGVMAVASVVLMLEANRLAQVAEDAEGLEAGEDDDMWSKGVHFDEEGHVLRDDVDVAAGAVGSVSGTALQARRRAAAPAGVGLRTLQTCVLVLVVGALAIGVAVTGLKYMHELIETAAAAAIIGSGG